jgi:L-ascorbate metabolism protein UlaG (beta-lactamase superfamily)
MNMILGTLVPLCVFLSASVMAQQPFDRDSFNTSGGKLEITFIGHGTLMCAYDNKIIHVDPVGREADYTKMPKADLILVTHEHGDHLDADAIGLIETESTQIVLTEICRDRLGRGVIMKNGETKTVCGLKIEAVPAYNLIHKRSNGKVFHPKGQGNGYVVTFGDLRVYFAGDTENIPEMGRLKNIDIAFLPMNLPYTMSPEMAAAAARSFMPGILYPYHYGSTDPKELVSLLKDVGDIEVRIRELQ